MIDWRDISDSCTLSADQVHVWRACCTLSPQILNSLKTYLITDELERAARFRFERDRLRFIAGRGILRHILSRYLNQPPERLQFTYGSHGKPELMDGGGIHFNLSHSGDWALYAIAPTPIGVDLEALRPVPQMTSIVERYFAKQEKAFFKGLSEDAKTDAFFRAWTCKEAYVKAIGQGLTLSLQAIDVELDPQKPLQFHHLPHSEPPSCWPLWGFEPAAFTRAALTLQHPYEQRPNIMYGDWELLSSL